MDTQMLPLRICNYCYSCNLLYIEVFKGNWNSSVFPKRFRIIRVCFHDSGPANNNRDFNAVQYAVAFATALSHVPSALRLHESEECDIQRTVHHDTRIFL
jgi:hypothetical protein